MTQYYFFKTVKDGSRNRLRPLSGQTDSRGVSINPSFNTQASRAMRESYPIGTVFCSRSCEDSNGFYSAGDLFPIGLPLGEYKDPSHMPTPEMNHAFELYQKSQEESFPTLFDMLEEKPARKARKPRTTTKPVADSEPVPSVNLLTRITTDSGFARPTIEMDGFCVEEDNWNLLLRNILTRTNTLMVGPTGTGKTELVLLACQKLGIECNVFNMGTIFDPISELLGVHRLVAGSSKFDYAKFAQDVQKPCVILLDELSRAPVTTNNVLFPCLDSRRTLPVDMAGGEDVRNIAIHPECVFIATANVGSEYTGTMSMDRALVGRFFPLELGYMGKEDEQKVLQKRFSVSKDDAANLVAVADTVRSKYSKTELSVSLSTRETIMAAKLIADGWSAQKAMELTFLPLFEGTRIEGERAVVMQIILSR